ncbi:MAG TPA: HlyC/CorC family transporter, partial [Candidatus Hydrogenedentes bacterium]|nr:HlyC/CorC family transporter [Candidatus Hydrogenedentota bacterium]
MSIVLALTIFAFAVVLQALFAGYEAGFVSTNQLRIRHLAEEEHQPRAARLLAYIQRPDRMLASLLIGTNLAVVMGAIAVTRQAEHSFSVLLGVSPSDVRPMAELAATLVAAPVLLIFAEIIPKSVFRTHPNRLSLALLPVIEFFNALMAPVSIPICWLTGALLRSVGEKHDYISPIMTSLEDVRLLVDEGADHGTIEREEQEMIHSVIDLQSTRAKEIMVPRIDIQALPDTAARSELVTLFEDSGRTRIPIYHETIDTVVGMINAYDILMDTEPERDDINRFIKDVMHVPDSIKVDDLFSALKESKQHLAIVTDEYGGTDG